jgi:hypothetical protein
MFFKRLNRIREYKFKILGSKMLRRRSQWPRGLRHEMSSVTQTLGSWVESHSSHGCLSAFIL